MKTSTATGASASVIADTQSVGVVVAAAALHSVHTSKVTTFATVGAAAAVSATVVAAATSVASSIRQEP